MEFGKKAVEAPISPTNQEAGPPFDPEPSSRILPWDFSCSGKISQEQLRSINMINDVFARNLTHHLGAWFRTRVQVSLAAAEQIPFGEFLLRIPELAYICPVRLEPLRAVSVLQAELTLAPPIIDLLLGGEGSPSLPRELTDIEESIFAGVMEAVCRELTAAWQTAGLSFTAEKRQMQTQTPGLIPASEKTLCLSFELQVSEVRGFLKIAFPAMAANTILRRLAGEQMRKRRHPQEVRRRLVELVRGCRTQTALHLPPARVPAKALRKLRPGSILMLNLTARTRAEFRAGGTALFAAEPVEKDDHRAAHLLNSRETRP